MSRLKTLNQLLTDNPNILSFVTVPAAYSEQLDSATLKTAIIRRCGDVEPYYQKPADFTLFGNMWFTSHEFLFAHAVGVWESTYNPIENYDRYEEETISGTRSETTENSDTHSGTDTTTTSGSRNNTDTHSGTDTTTTSGSRNNTDTHSGTDTTTTSGTRESEIAGFNSSGYSDANKETTSGSEALLHGEAITTAETTSGSEAIQHGEAITTAETTSGSESTQHGHKIDSAGESAEENETEREAHVHGNIGITTAQQMLTAEIDLASKFWIYDYIASAFETDNFITVYNSYYDGGMWE